MALAASALAFINVAPAQAADPVDIQILATNDFHGRLVDESGGVAGAAKLSGAVKQLRAENPNTNFVAAGDLIGASTFESFIQHDEPTIAALNEAGLDVSATGNHEFDQGFSDLADRVQSLADWQYIVANLRLKSDNSYALAPTWTNEVAGVTIGYVGAVTEELPALVSPAGIANVNVTDIVTEVNAAAADLQADGADVVIMLVHEGAPGTNCATMADSGAWADIINSISPDVDAIVSGHTHLAYNCSFPVDGLDHDRPVVSAGQYGTNLNQLVFTVDPDDGVISGITQEILPLDGQNEGDPVYPADPVVEQIVADAVDEADVLGAVELGDISAPANRGRWAEPDNDDEGTDPQIVENRGSESSLGNLVAEAQRWATEPAEFGGAEIAFMNPGGLRANMAGPAVTYKQAAGVQPFANTLVNMTMTGAQIKTVLEQQWQRDNQGNVPTRPFLRLGTSEGFEYSYDPSLPEGDRITSIWLNGAPLKAGQDYSVTVNSFLAAGGDNFREFANGSNPRDTGQIDLQAMVKFMEAFASNEPLEISFAQHSIGATATAESISFSSLAMTGSGDPVDTEVQVFDGTKPMGTVPVTFELSSTPFDEAGTASIPNTLPNDGKLHLVRVVGATTGTDIIVPVMAAPKSESSTTAKVKPAKVKVNKTRAKVVVKVKADGQAASGRVEVKIGGKTYKAKLNDNGRAVVKLATFAKTGKQTVRVKYLGNKTTEPSSTKATFRVVK